MFCREGALCDENGQLGPREFEAVMREQVRVNDLVRGPSSFSSILIYDFFLIQSFLWKIFSLPAVF